MAIKTTDTIETTQANSGGAKVTRTLTELNDLISTEESGRLDALETSVDTATTGLLDRTTALETSVDTTTTGLLDRMTAAEGDIDDLEAVAPVTGAPTMAVAASKVLTIGTKPAEGATVTIGTTVYKFRATALGTGAKAACVLDLTADPPHDGDFVTLGLITYTFKTSLTPTAGEVLIEATSADSADNLVAAVSGGAGAGTKYATGTSASPNITVARVDNTMTVEYNVVGFLGNSFDTLTGNGEGAMTHGSFHAPALHGGIDAQAAYDVYDGGDIENSIINLKKAIEDSGTEGTHYGTGTAVHPTVEVSDISGTTLTALSKTKGVAGNSIALAETLADGSWAGAATALSGGVNGTAATAGAIRFAAGELWVSTTTSTISSSNWRRAVLELPAPIIINDAAAAGAYVLTAASQTVVVLDNNGENIELPESTGSGIEIRIQNRNSADHDVVVSDSSGDVIDADGTITLAQYSSCVLVDTANGVWSQF